MRTAALFVAGLLCLALSGPAHAVKLEYKVKQGDVWKQKITMNGDGVMEAAGMKIDMTMEVTTNTSNKVTSVAGTGDFVSSVEYKPAEMKLTVNGMAVTPPQQPATNLTITTTKLGKPIKVEGLEKSGLAGNTDFTKFMNVAPSQFPDKDVQVGETWDASPATDQLPMKITGKLLSVQKIGGKEIAELEYTFKISGEAFGKMLKQLGGMDVEMGGPGMTGTSVTLVDVATGIPGASKGKMEMDFTIKINGMELRQVMKMNVTSQVVR